MNTGPIFQVKHSQLAKDSIWFNTKNLSNKSRYNTSLLFYHKKCKKKIIIIYVHYKQLNISASSRSAQPRVKIITKCKAFALYQEEHFF
jgi:hypothetical protein